MELRLALFEVETLQPAFYSSPASLDDLEATTRAIATSFKHPTGRQKVGLVVDAQSLTGATRGDENDGMRSDPLRELVLYEKEMCPGLEMRTQMLDVGGP